MQKLLLWILLVLVCTSCYTDIDEPWLGQDSFYTSYEPILMERGEMEASIASLSPRIIESTGKIYFYNSYIFLVEQYSGVHVINNSNPRNPIPIAFLQIPGCVDVAVKSDILYADNAVDLLSIDISNITDIQVVNRQKDVFPELPPPDFGNLPASFEKENRPENTLIVGWKKS